MKPLHEKEQNLFLFNNLKINIEMEWICALCSKRNKKHEKNCLVCARSISYSPSSYINPNVIKPYVLHGVLSSTVRIEQLLEMIKNGILLDLNKRDSQGWTPLIALSKAGRSDLVQVLCDANADPNLQTRLGWTALHYAVDSGYYNVVIALLSNTAIQVNARIKVHISTTV